MANAALAEMAAQLESLGQNCELGLFQEGLGLAPLGLLRFAATSMDGVVQALNERFQRIGKPEFINIERHRQTNEFQINDTAYGFKFHTWINDGITDDEVRSRLAEKRLPFLARKLLEDLDGGYKLFVFKGANPLSKGEIWPLVEALREYQKATLLWVTVSRDNMGAVERLADNAMVGFLDRFAPFDYARDLSIEGWSALCRNAISAWQESRKEAAGSSAGVPEPYDVGP